MPADLAIDFFISYTSADRNWAEWIAWHLEEAGYRVVIQAWDFPPGSDFVVNMRQAASGAQRTIAVLSPSYLKSGFAIAEWGAAFAADPTGQSQKLLPVRVADVALEGLDRTRVLIDLVGVDEAMARERLISGVRRERAKPLLAPPFPSCRSGPDAPKFPAEANRERVSPAVREPRPTTPNAVDGSQHLGDTGSQAEAEHDPTVSAAAPSTHPGAKGQLPELEFRSAMMQVKDRLGQVASGRTLFDGQHPKRYEWLLRVEVYAEGVTRELVIPDHRCRCELHASPTGGWDQTLTVTGNPAGQTRSPFLSLRRSGDTTQKTRTSSRGHEQLIITGPGPVTFSATAFTPDGPFSHLTNFDARLTLGLADADDPIVVDFTLIADISSSAALHKWSSKQA